MDENEQDEKHADEEQEGRRVVDSRRIRGPLQPIPLQRKNKQDHAACQPEDGILLPQSATANHLEDVKEKGGGNENGKYRDSGQPNLRMRLMKNESVTFTI